MRVAILCPGPSLAKTWEPAFSGCWDLVIGVNRAALLGCDWWCCGDEPYLETVAATPRTGVCTIQNGRRTQARMSSLPGRRVLLWSELAGAQAASPWNYSMTAALVLAHHLGHRSVAIFGCDWSGSDDFDGPVPPLVANAVGMRRGEDRWAEERAEVARVITALGLLVTRVKPQEPSR